MSGRQEGYPGGENSRRFKLAAIAAAGTAALGGFAGTAARAETPDSHQNPLIRQTDIKLKALSLTMRRLAGQNIPNVLPPERIRYYQKGGSPNASRYVISEPVLQSGGRWSYDHLVMIIKDGSDLPASTSLLQGASSVKYQPDEKFEHGTVMERDSMYWLEKMANSGPKPISEGMFPLVNLAPGYQDKVLPQVYNKFTQEITDFISSIDSAGQ